MQSENHSPVKGKKRPFTVEEDHILMQYVHTFGCHSWNEIAKKMTGRTPKQCRERWNGHINPNINKGPWSPDEDRIIATKQRELGNKWADIAKFLPGRTDILVKNRWNTSIKYRKNLFDTAISVTQPQMIQQPAPFNIDMWLLTRFDPMMRLNTIPPLLPVHH